jgi:asparagine synthase (glutamine-hydrolysing)
MLEAMTDVMTHRGPNDRGLYVADGIGLGVRRLSIVDVPAGHQPVSNEAGDVWAIQNGELYNHLDLREPLEAEGHAFRSRCDTEILPHLYERYGSAFPTRLRGMFGVAVWDERHRLAVLARDRLGIKPLYFARRGDLLLFASELKGLLASGLIAPELDYGAIDAYLTLGFIPGPMTPLAGVSKVMPGEFLVVADGDVRAQRYWVYPEPHVPVRRSEHEYRELLVEKLDESVRLRLMSDVPLGAMLSGGLDSSLVVALMARHMSEPVKTFSVGFAEAGQENELEDARRVAELFGTDHHELELSFAKDTVELDELVWHMDEPLADLSALGFLALSELAARDVTVALSGQGADELFGGYTKHRAAALVGAWQALPAPLGRLGARAALRAPGRLRRAGQTLAAADPVDRLLAMSGRVDGGLRRRLYLAPLAALDRDSARDAVAVRLGGVTGDPLPVTLFLDAQLALVDDMLHYFDRASMAHSLEVRVPFLDHEFVEYCAQIPANLKVRGLTTKYILKEAARGLVPKQAIEKRKVGFFRGSVGDWFEAQATRSIDQYLLRPDPCTSAFLDQDEVRRMVRRQVDEGVQDDRHLLLGILMLEIWLASYVPRALAAAPAALGAPGR